MSSDGLWWSQNQNGSVSYIHLPVDYRMFLPVQRGGIPLLFTIQAMGEGHQCGNLPKRLWIKTLVLFVLTSTCAGACDVYPPSHMVWEVATYPPPSTLWVLHETFDIDVRPARKKHIVWSFILCAFTKRSTNSVKGREFAQDDAINELLQNINGSTKQLSLEMWRLPISMNSSFSVANIPPQGSTRRLSLQFWESFVPGLILDASTYRVPSVPSDGSIQHIQQKMGVASVIEPVNLRRATDSMKKPKVVETQSPGDQNLQEYNAWAVPKFEGTKQTNAEVVSSWEIKQLYANPQVTWYILISLIDNLTRIQQKKWCGSKRPMIEGAPC